MTKTFDFAVSISYDDRAKIDQDTLQKMVNAAVLDVIPDLGEQPPTVSTTPGGISKVLVVVKDGAAEIRAVSGVADVALVDLDREGDYVEEDDIEGIVSFERHTDDGAAKMESELESARTALRSFLPDGVEP